MNTIEAQYIGPAQHVVVGAPAITGKLITFPLDKGNGCLMGFATYAPGVPGRTLTITVQVGESTSASPANTFYDFDSNTIAITASGAFTISIPGGARLVHLKFASAGAAGADDQIGLVLSGLPQGTTIV